VSYRAWRQKALNIEREGGAVASTSLESEVGTLLRYIGFVRMRQKSDMHRRTKLEIRCVKAADFAETVEAYI
jgi:hypothetical protein